MNYDDRIRRTRQTSLVSSACAATTERMAMRPLCASICRATGQDAGTLGIADNLITLNFANDSEIFCNRGGYAQELTPNYLISKRLSEETFLPAAIHYSKITQDIPYLRHAATRWRRISYIPGTAPCRSKPRRMYPGLFVSVPDDFGIITCTI